MFSIKVRPEIIQHCQQQIKRYNFGQRCVANGTPDQQLTGIIGQTVIMEQFDLGFIDGSTGFDGGVDIVYEGIKMDVKTMGRTTDVRKDYVNNFIALQINFDNDVYVFCSFNKTKNELTVCGWTTKADFLKKAHFFPKGSTRTRSYGTTFETFADLYEIANKDLVNVDSINELKACLREIKKTARVE
jgi:hypothetical protein